MSYSAAIEKAKQLIESLEIDKARGYLEGLTADPAEAIEAHLWLARLELMGHKLESARPHIDAAIALAPGSASALSVQGLFFLMKDEYPAAISTLEASRAADPDLAMNYANLSLAYQKTGRVAEALEAGRKGVELAPGDPSAHYAYSQALGANGQFAESLEEAGTTIKLNPLHELAYLYAGTIFEAAGHVDSMVELFNAGLQANPRSLPLRRKLLEVHLKKGNSQLALEQASAIANVTETVQDSLAAGECARSAGNRAVAEWYFKFAGSRSPNHWQPFYALGTLYAEDGKWEAAIPEFRDAIRCNPVWWEAHNQLGLALMALGEYDQAEPEFQAAIQSGPDRPEPALNLVKTLAAMGRKSEAISHAQGVLRGTDTGTFFHNEASQLLAALVRQDSAN